MAILSERLRVLLSFCYTVLEHVAGDTRQIFKFGDTSASFWELLGNRGRVTNLLFKIWKIMFQT